MPADLPIACSLSATELPKRLAEMAALGRAHLVHASVHGTRAVLRFAVGTEIRDQVETIVAAESECCPFLTMRVIDDSDAVVLAIDAPPGAESVLAEFVEAFRGRPPVVAPT